MNSESTDTFNIARKQLIDLVLSDLRGLRNHASNEYLYALEENIKYFEATKSFLKYLKWVIQSFARIDGEKIKELSDFHLRNGAWEEHLMKALLSLEQSKFSDLIGPIRNELLVQFRELVKKKNRPLVVLNLGCGAMEIEHQVINQLKEEPLSVPVVFVGIDNSKAASHVAENNLKEYADSFKRESNVALSQFLEELTTSGKPYLIKYVVTDVPEALSQLTSEKVDIVYYSKFLHHLAKQEGTALKQVLIKIADRVIEFDDYNGFYLWITSVLVGWNLPILMNGAVFTSCRVPTKADLKKEDLGWKTKIFPMKGYIKTFQRAN